MNSSNENEETSPRMPLICAIEDNNGKLFVAYYRFIQSNSAKRGRKQKIEKFVIYLGNKYNNFLFISSLFKHFYLKS